MKLFSIVKALSVVAIFSFLSIGHTGEKGRVAKSNERASTAALLNHSYAKLRSQTSDVLPRPLDLKRVNEKNKVVSRDPNIYVAHPWSEKTSLLQGAVKGIGRLNYGYDFMPISQSHELIGVHKMTYRYTGLVKVEQDFDLKVFIEQTLKHHIQNNIQNFGVNGEQPYLLAIGLKDAFQIDAAAGYASLGVARIEAPFTEDGTPYLDALLKGQSNNRPFTFGVALNTNDIFKNSAKHSNIFDIEVEFVDFSPLAGH